MSDSESPVIRVLLIRHGQVANHKGDVPLTDLGMAQATMAGEWFANNGHTAEAVMSGETIRAKDSAKYFIEGCRSAGGTIPDSTVSFGLRNPDLYLGGHRINMGEGAETLAAQSPSVVASNVEQLDWYVGLMEADDRVGYWLQHPNPPGDTARAVGQRIDAFVRSCADVPQWRGGDVVAMTHSPVLRAVRFHHWGEFTREPPFLHGYSLELSGTGELTLHAFATETGDIPATSRPGPGIVRPEKD